MTSPASVDSSHQPSLSLPHGLALRPWQRQDAAGLEQALRDPLVQRYAGFLVHDRAEAASRILRYSGLWDRREGAAWVISDRGGSVLGAVGFGEVPSRPSTGSVGYWLLPEARGRGMATAAVRASTELVFHRLHWRRIELYHAVENERSCAVARRCGFAFEGVMRDAMHYPDDGRWSDEHLHARLFDDP